MKDLRICVIDGIGSGESQLHYDGFLGWICTECREALAEYDRFMLQSSRWDD